MARPRKATAVLEATGAFEKNPDRRRENEPIPPAADPIKPKLKGRASKVWDEFAPICIGMGTLKRGDELEFATYCELQAEYEKDKAAFQTSRMALKGKYAERFGILGSGSRAKLSLDGPGWANREQAKPPVDAADKYFQVN